MSCPTWLIRCWARMGRSGPWRGCRWHLSTAAVTVPCMCPRSEPVHAYMSAVTGGLALGGPVTGCSQSAITCPRPAGGFTCHRGGEFTSRPAGGKQFPAVHADPGVMRFHHSVHGRRRHLSRPRGGACRAALEWQDLECATRAEPAGALRALRWATRSSPSQQSSR